MQTRKNAVLLAFMMILTSLLLLVSLSANITHAAEKGSTLNGQTQQFNKGEGNPNSKDSKSDSEKATPSKGTNSEDNSTTQSNQTATVTINKIASDTQKQLAGAHLQIWENGKLVKDFTTNGEASVFNLPKGNYILRETSAPTGYALASDQPFTVNDENVTTTIGTTVRAGTSDKGNKIYIDPLKEKIYIDGEHNQTELGYCFNIDKLPPVGRAYQSLGQQGTSYNRTSIGDGSPVNNYMDNPRQENDEDSLKAIRTIIWNGFASNPDNIQTKYGLTDDELYRITQRAIWYYTDKGLLTLGMPNDALDIKASEKVLLEALQDIVKTNEKSPIPNGMKIDFFTPDNDRYQSILAASFTSTQIKPGTKPGKPVTVTLVDPKHVEPKHEDTKPNKPVDTKPNKPVDTKPNKPVDTKPNKPVDTKPNKPVDTKPNKPVDTKPNKPSTPEDTKPNKPSTPEDTKPNKPVDTKPNKPSTPEDTKPNKPNTPEVVQPKANKPTTPEVEKPNKPSTPEVVQPKANKPTTEEVVQPKATEQPSDKKAKVNYQKAVYKANNSQKMPKATSVVYTANNSEALPKTGAKQSALIVLIGLGMVVLSGFLYKKEF